MKEICHKCQENEAVKDVSLEPYFSVMWCQECYDNYDGPSDQEQEDAAESADYAKQRCEDDLVFAGRGHLIGK